jgi:anti-sigma factor (TIGR02949 family)
MDIGKTVCERIQKQLDSFVSGEVSGETRDQISKHLRDCPGCSAYAEALSQVRQSLRRAVENEPVPLYLGARVRDRIRSRESKRTSIFAWAPAFGLAAAVLLIFFSGWFAWHGAGKSGEVERLAREEFIDSLYAQVATVFRVGLGDHLHCAHFRQFPKDAPTVEEMTAQLGPDYAPLLPSVRDRIPQGHDIVLAHQCTYRDRRFIHMISKGNGQLLSIVITQRQPGESFESGNLAAIKNAAGVSLYGSAAEQFQIAGFEAGDHLAFVISNMGHDENLEATAGLAPSVHQFLAAMQG